MTTTEKETKILEDREQEYSEWRQDIHIIDTGLNDRNRKKYEYLLHHSNANHENPKSNQCKLWSPKTR